MIHNKHYYDNIQTKYDEMTQIIEFILSLPSDMSGVKKKCNRGDHISTAPFFFVCGANFPVYFLLSEYSVGIRKITIANHENIILLCYSF